MYKKIFTFFTAIIITLTSYADEGLWLPMLLEQLNQSDMQSKGLKLTAEDIYSVNKSSLKDAICLFGGGCTAEVVSENALLFTNHHCGYYFIQSHSTLENNYLSNGYWAKNFKEELPCKGLTAEFLIKMEDVTTSVLKGFVEGMSEDQRDAIIKTNSEKIEAEAIKGTHYKAQIKPFYYGNEFYLFITEIFNDIRLVGAPPSSIGKFGGDTDNWEWPRHTGDFAVFRIYADKDNNAAEYSEENVPYKPKKSLSISIKGVKENDFTMVFGYPGRTQEYLTSYGVNLIGNIEDPVMYGIRDKKLNIMAAAMSNDPLTKLQYSAKYASVANYWKKWIGESKGLKKSDALTKKKKLENEFTIWLNADNLRKNKYGTLLNTFEKVYTQITPIALAYDYFNEAGKGIEIIKYAWGFNNLVTKCNSKSSTDEEIKKLAEQYMNGAKGFFKNNNFDLDKKILVTLLKLYYDNTIKNYTPEIFSNDLKNKYSGNIEKYAEYVYKNSLMTSEAGVEKLLSNFKKSKAKKIIKDPLFVLTTSLYNNFYNNIIPSYISYNNQLDSLYRIYMDGLREMYPKNKYYPDANLTLRLAYGKVSSYKPKDAVEYNYFTTLEGLIKKENPDIEDYKEIPEKLKELYIKKDYGRYSSDSIMHVGFIANNHTTGGNSGSPVLNGNGELIGINFDRVWEGTMSDINFDPDQCRNITLDIRYALFIIDKFAEAKWLIDEIKIVE